MIVELDMEKHKEYLEKEVYPKYKEKQRKKSKLLSSSLIPLRPDLGYFINVEGIEIAENCFKEEYNQIIKAYYSVLDKLNKDGNKF